MSELYSNNFFKSYNRNVYSQNGEDGILEEILNRLNITSGWVCEFGAWDGIHLSNTFNLVQRGFNAVFIEGDPEKYTDLLATVNTNPNICPINAYVDHVEESENSLDNLLKTTDIPVDFDVLSVDIDSYDYQVWKSLKTYNPKVVVIEINSAVGTQHDDYINDSVVYNGTGFKPMFDLAIEKGYTFALHTGNMIFVRNDLFNLLNIQYADPRENFRIEWGGR